MVWWNIRADGRRGDLAVTLQGRSMGGGDRSCRTDVYENWRRNMDGALLESDFGAKSTYRHDIVVFSRRLRREKLAALYDALCGQRSQLGRSASTSTKP
eukprot:6872058-Pyramimonas_sp.AAC.1